MINGILDVIRNNFDKFRKILQRDNNERLIVKIVDNQFNCIFFDYGRNKRVNEEVIVFNFLYYLEDVE